MLNKGNLGTSLIVMLALLCQCEPTKKERPSPLRADSINFKSGQVKIAYSSPAVRDRDIWGELVPYNQLWRTGANQATVLSSTISIKIDGVEIDSGAYAVFTQPGENTWQLMLNEHWNQWGTYEFDSSLTVATYQIVPEVSEEFSERMRFYFRDESLVFHWENLTFSLPIE